MKFLAKVGIPFVSFSKFAGWAALLGGFCILGITMVTTADVTGRYLLNKPVTDAIEIVVSLMIFVVFLGLAYTQALGGHLRAEFLLKRFSPRGRAALEILSLIICLFLFSIIAWQAWDWTIESWRINELMSGILDIPYFPMRLGLSVGVTLFNIRLIIDIIRIVKQSTNPSH